MSIINEALKKAQRSAPGPQSDGAADRQPKIYPTVKTRVTVPSKAAKKNRMVVALLACAFAALVAYSGFTVAPKFLSRRRALALPPQPASAMPTLVLNGIVYDEEKPYAIINNKVLLKGDLVDGAALSEINRDSVKFVFNGREYELKAKE